MPTEGIRVEAEQIISLFIFFFLDNQK